MKKVLIVDDETLVRMMLHSIVDWEQLGYEIGADAINGEQACQYLKNHKVDLVITDMKMPIMDGIGFLKEVSIMEDQPQVVVLSGYDDFHLVREAFRLGAYDYMLKADITGDSLSAMVKKMEQQMPEKAEAGSGYQEKQERHQKLVDMVMGKTALDEEFFGDSDYSVVQFEIDDFMRHASRFGLNTEESMINPMLEFANQIPRVTARCVLGAVSPSRYVMYYRITDREQWEDNIISTCSQLKRVWNNYMNLPVSVGISSMGNGKESLLSCFEEAGSQLKLRYLSGKASVCFPWDKNRISPAEYDVSEARYHRLLCGLKDSDEMTVSEEKKNLSAALYEMDLEQARKECLYIICHLANILQENNDDVWSLFQDDVNYYDKLGRIDHVRSLDIWINNYFRWIMDYVEHNYDRRQADLIVKSKRFIKDNYANPELTLGSVAGYVGLNEKYFSSRFTKEVGNTFSNYLTEVRILKAKELMDKTNLKIYEISQNVGYNNVEHFNRVFKKVCKVSPGGYKKSDI